jgi:hypothetical protein
MVWFLNLNASAIAFGPAGLNGLFARGQAKPDCTRTQKCLALIGERGGGGCAGAVFRLIDVELF